MITRDRADPHAVIKGQWSNTGIAVHDMLAGKRNTRQQLRHCSDQIVDLFFVALDTVRIINANISRANQHAIANRIGQTQSIVTGLKIHHVTAQTGKHLRVIENQVRTLGPANVMAVYTHQRIDWIYPRATGINHQFRLHCYLLTT